MGTLSILNKLSKDSLLVGTGVWVKYDPNDACTYPDGGGLYLVKLAIGCNGIERESRYRGFWDQKNSMFLTKYNYLVARWLLEEYK